MSDNQHIDDEAVDRREETVSTEQPGYVATKQVSRDVAAEARLQSFKINRILYTLLGILEILLGLRFVLKLLAANADTVFSSFIYNTSHFFLTPFDALLGTPALGSSTIELNTLIAMAVYALLFWILTRLMSVLLDRSTSRTVTTSTHEHTPPPGPGQ